MRLRSALYLVLGILTLVFVLANWDLLTTPTPINLLITTVSLPAAVVGLIVVGAVLAVDWTSQTLHRRAWERERRTLKEELERVRQQAENSEASRLRALEERFEREMAHIRVQLERLTGG
jgi:uncharacterized integral membrane protein